MGNWKKWRKFYSYEDVAANRYDVLKLCDPSSELPRREGSPGLNILVRHYFPLRLGDDAGLS